MNHPLNDPYTNCEAGQCNHDLARAVTIGDLLADDGPFPTNQMLVKLGIARLGVFDERGEPRAFGQIADGRRLDLDEGSEIRDVLDHEVRAELNALLLGR